MTSAPDGAGLYLHVPFCSAICPYCDFAVAVARRERRARFAERLTREIELVRDSFPHAFDTVYFGGGTPSALEARDLERILDAARAGLDVAPDAWLTLEANPEDVTAEAAAAWRALGVGMLSLGVQSFDDSELRFLGRRHRAAEARRAVERARAAGFPNVSLDLIFGLPGQELRAWERTLREAASLEPDHLSCYQLTIHEGTHFGRRRERGKLAELPEEAQAALYEATHRVLGEAGLTAYEVSNFARSPAHRSRHNVKYWNHTPYLGLGPSAHSFDGGRRWWNRRDLGAWEEAIDAGTAPVEGSETLDREALALEAVLLGLRTTDGVDLERLASRCGVRLRERNGAAIARLVADGLLVDRGDRLAPTVRGLAVADALARAFDLAQGAPPP